MNILKLTVILSVFAIFNWSCVQKVTKGNTMYYSDFDPFSLTGLQIDTMQLDSNNIMAKVEFISDIKKNVTTYCNNNRVKSEYNFDGRYWYENFEVNVEGCKEYCFVYILGSKKIVLSYCNNPFITDIYYLKTLILHTKESLYRYGFDKEKNIQKQPYQIIGDLSISNLADNKEVFLYKQVKEGIIEEYFYNYYNVDILTGIKQNERKTYYDIGGKSINWFFNCKYCLKSIE